MHTIVAHVVRVGASSEGKVETKTSFKHIRLTPDQAVPLSLMLTEALTNALKHPGQGADTKTILSVSFRYAAKGSAVLKVLNTMPTADGPVRLKEMESTGLGQQLLSAFATQLAGVLEVGERDGVYVRIELPLLPTTEGAIAGPDA